MSDQTPYTPSEARVCIDFCNAAMKRRQPDGSFMDMEDADEAFSRFIAQVRAEAWSEGHAQAMANIAWPQERKGNPYREEK